MNPENVVFSFAGIVVDDVDLTSASLACVGLAILRKAGRVLPLASIEDFKFEVSYFGEGLSLVELEPRDGSVLPECETRELDVPIKFDLVLPRNLAVEVEGA